MKKIAVLGSTGSIGKSTLQVAKHLSDSICVTALAAYSNIELLAEQIREFQPEIVGVYDKAKADVLKNQFPHLKIVSGKEGLEEIASHLNVDFVVVAIVGMAALFPTITALNAGKEIGLANKEVLVAAGEYISKLAKIKKCRLIPIDSEHSAIFQCLQGKKKSEVRRIVLTASGGPFRYYTLTQLKKVTLEEALTHPTWNMGPKITIDSSTLMNKGLEMIEARWLFDFPHEKIEVVIHPQSIIHSFVEWIDGCIFAEMSEPDMRFPIQYALTYPERKKGLLPPYNFLKNAVFEFLEPDYERFPALVLAKEALRRKPSFSCYMNAANEVLVGRFLKKEISWPEIISRLEKLLSRHSPSSLNSVEAIIDLDQTARRQALEI